jgi:hypothetical protein
MAEKADGVTISGGAESGSTVSVNWGGVIKSAVASVGGTWSAAFAAGEVPQDALSTTLAVSAQDAAGNTSNIALKNVAVDAPATTPPTTTRRSCWARLPARSTWARRSWCTTVKWPWARQH